MKREKEWWSKAHKKDIKQGAWKRKKMGKQVKLYKQSVENQASKGESSRWIEEMVQPMRVDVEDPTWKTRTMPTYKLRSDIEQTTDLKKILEERVLDSHVTLSLRELLGITKEFHGTIVDLVKRKRQQSDEEEDKP